MKRTFQRGAGNLDAFLIIGLLIFVMLLGPTMSNTSSKSSTQDWTLGDNSYTDSNTNLTPLSPESKNYRLSLSTGNAGYAYQSYEEYIVLENNGDQPVGITGWQLRNGKDRRVYNSGGSLQRFSSDVAIIPQATLLLSPQGTSVMSDVVLESGERAVITTGSVGVRHPYRIVSFKENICTGYLENLPDYSFQPSLSSYNCPRPELEPGVANLDVQCRKVIERLPSCATPEFELRDSNDEPCSICLEGERLSSSCAAFIKEHFSYRGCIAYHAGDSGFTHGKDWRIYLGRGWEMWAEDYEAVELFDRLGNLIISENY
jgi:hypothetical protein